MRQQTPNLPEIEKSVLGIALSDPDYADKIVSLLPEGNFYNQKHEMIYEAIRDMIADNDPVDIITVTERLGAEGSLEKVGGAYYLTELTDGFNNYSNTEYYCRLLLEYSMRRKAHTHLMEATSNIYNLEKDVFEELSSIQQNIFDIENGLGTNALVSLDHKLVEAYDHLVSIDGTPGGLTGFGTGFGVIDNMTGGFQPGELIIVAARPSMGKTSLALNIAVNAWKMFKAPVGIFSFEMSSKRLANRILTAEARVDAKSAKQGRLTADEWERIEEAKANLQGIPIIIDDDHDGSLGTVISRARRMVKEGAKCIIIDYLQLMHAEMRSSANREQEIAKIARSLKKLAMDLGVPIIALSQLSRAVESRGGDKRPQLSDLRESGAIEQDADIVAFIYRAERYGFEVDDNGNSTRGIAEVIIGKNRDGPIGTVELTFIDKYARFEDLVTYYTEEDVRNNTDRPDNRQTTIQWN